MASLSIYTLYIQFYWMDIHPEYRTAMFGKTFGKISTRDAVDTRKSILYIVTCVLRIERYWFDYPNSNNYANQQRVNKCWLSLLASLKFFSPASQPVGHFSST
jgi:hypothetical protein